MKQNLQSVMTVEELYASAKHLVEKYLPSDRKQHALDTLSEALEPPYKASPKDFLYILTVEKIMPFDSGDQVKVKELAFNLGI